MTEAAPLQPDKTGNALLRLEKATFGYGKNGASQPILRNVSLTLRPGDFCLLVGPNGSGKTTLMRGLLGLVPVYSGGIHWAIPKERASYLPQEASMDAGGPATALDVVRTSNPPVWGNGRRAAERALEQVGLSGKGGTAYGDLSGGQRRRVLVARALAGNPSLILMDEPIANVDAETVSLLETLLTRLCSEEKLAVLAAVHSHDWAPAAKRIQVKEGTLHG